MNGILEFLDTLPEMQVMKEKDPQLYNDFLRVCSLYICPDTSKEERSKIIECMRKYDIAKIEISLYQFIHTQALADSSAFDFS